jgi:hypothetical protein
MTEPFLITVPYKGAEKEIEVQLQVTGYTHRFRVLMDNGAEVLFEPDEERQYRAIIPPEQGDLARSIDPVLLQAVAETLHEVLS